MQPITNLQICPVTFRQANAFVKDHHRHSGTVTGGKFCLGLIHEGQMVGVAICGRPVSRFLDDGLTVEINRLCTDGTPNACSKLYGACCRVAREMGYQKAITYTLESENGASLKASGFRSEGQAGGKFWRGERQKNRNSGKTDSEMKVRWSKDLQRKKLS